MPDEGWSGDPEAAGQPFFFKALSLIWRRHIAHALDLRAGLAVAEATVRRAIARRETCAAHRAP